MYLQDCKINYFGNPPNQANIDIIERILAKLQSKTPSDSAMSLHLVSGLNQIQGKLRVSSLAGIFEANILGTEMIDVVRGLKTEMKSQMQHWVSTRRFK